MVVIKELLIVLAVNVLVHLIFKDVILFNAVKFVKLAVAAFIILVVILSETFNIFILIVFAVNELPIVILGTVILLVEVIISALILVVVILL